MLGKLNVWIFCLNMMTYWTNIILFGIKSVLISKKKLIANLSAIKNIFKPKKISCVDETTDFHDKELPSAGSNHTCLGVITNNSSLKKDENYYPQAFLKTCKYIEKKKVIRHITEDIEIFSSDSDKEFENVYF